MLLAQISDLHYLPRGTLALGRVDVAQCLDEAITALNALRPKPEAVLITGDLTDDGDAAVYAELVEQLGRLDAPVLPLPGNHDDRELMRSAFAPLRLFAPAGPLCFVREFAGFRLIGLDSLIPGDPAGCLGSDQLAWLDECLGESCRPTVIALHHPPFATGIDHMDGMMLEDGAELAEVVGRHSQVIRVICGHVHRTIQAQFAGTLGMVAPGTAHAIELTLEGGPARWVQEPSGMLLHEWRHDRGLVSHLHFIGRFPGGRFGDA